MLIVAVSNCHGGRYGFYLLEILKKYFNLHANFVYYYNALYIDHDFTDDEKIMIRKADIVLCQKITSDIKLRKYIHHDIIKTLVNPDCIFIIIPYITNINLYWSGSELLNVESFISYNITDKEFNDQLIKEIDKIKHLCMDTDLPLANILLSKYDTYQYFRNPCDPTGYLFLEGAILMIKSMRMKIDESINILDDFINVVKNDLWGHDIYSTPICPSILNKMKFKFDNENIVQPIYEKSIAPTISYLQYFEYVKNNVSFLTYRSQMC